MNSDQLKRSWFMQRVLVVAMVALACSAQATAAERARRGRDAADAKQVEFFAAIERGELEVRFIPKDTTSANVLIENKTDQPLTIQLPEAFAGVPVLAQAGLAGPAANAGNGGGGGGGGAQGLGGGLGGGGGGFGGGGFGGFGGGGGFFNVAPDRVGKIEVACVCLEHGKTDPTPRMKYEIKPITTFTSDQRVIELCKMLGRGEIPQNAAQAAAWHLADSLSWQELASKNRVELRKVNYFERYFNPRELTLAVRIVSEATRRGQASSDGSGGDRYSSSTGPVPSFLQTQGAQ